MSHNVGDTVTLTFSVDPDEPPTVTVTAPNGDQSTPAPTGGPIDYEVLVEVDAPGIWRWTVDTANGSKSFAFIAESPSVPLATPADLELFGEEGISEPKATFLLGLAQGVVRAYCGWHLTEITEDLTVDGIAGRWLSLPTMQLTAVTAITVDGAEIDLTDVELNIAGRLWRSAGWVAELRGIVASVRHGYAVVPPELQMVVCSLALRLHLNPAMHGSEGLGSYSVAYLGGVLQAGSLTKTEQLVLNKFKIPGRP